MSDTQSDQSVLPFPGELRNEIYRNLVKKTYLALRKIPESQSPDTNEPPKPLAASAGLVILRVSKATSTEALKILYEESIFLFKVDYGMGFSHRLPPERVAGLMNNVSFVISGAYDDSGFWAMWQKHFLMRPRTLELFTGTERFRNVMRIRFMNSAKITCYSIPESFDRAMIDLGAFRKLVVEFESRGNPGSEMTRLTSEQAQAVFQSECEEFKDYKLKDVFEPAYGPALQGTLHNACNYTRYLEFYPRQYLVRELTAKAGEALEKAATLAEGERAAALLQGIVETLKLL